MFEKLLDLLAEEYGYRSVEEMLADYASDSVAPAICTEIGCEYTQELEPDQDEGYCPECGKNTMKSCFVLAGII